MFKLKVIKPVRKIAVKDGNLATRMGLGQHIPVRKVRRVKIEVKYIPSD